MRVSVVMPTHARTGYGWRLLPLGMTAMLQQSRRPEEVLIVYDPGTPQAVHDQALTQACAFTGIRKQIAQRMFRRLESPSALLWDKRNFGVDTATGHIVAQADDDDWYRSGYIAALMDHYTNHPKSPLLNRVAETYNYNLETSRSLSLMRHGSAIHSVRKTWWIANPEARYRKYPGRTSSSDTRFNELVRKTGVMALHRHGGPEIGRNVVVLRWGKGHTSGFGQTLKGHRDRDGLWLRRMLGDAEAGAVQRIYRGGQLLASAAKPRADVAGDMPQIKCQHCRHFVNAQCLLLTDSEYVQAVTTGKGFPPAGSGCLQPDPESDQQIKQVWRAESSKRARFRPRPLPALPYGARPYHWIEQPPTWGIGNFVMATPALQTMARPVRVWFADAELRDLYAGTDWLEPLTERPYGEPWGRLDDVKARRLPGESDYELYHRLWGTGEMPAPYVPRPWGTWSDNMRVAVVCGCAGEEYREAKRIAPARLQRIVDTIADAGKVPVVLGTEADRRTYWTDVDLLRAESHLGQTSLTEAVRLLAGCGSFASNDTGLYHVAAALYLPGAVIWGSTIVPKGRCPNPLVWHVRGLPDLDGEIDMAMRWIVSGNCFRSSRGAA